MEPIFKQINKIQFTILEVEKNRVFNCKNDICYTPEKNCYIKNRVSLTRSKNSLIASYVLLNMRNISNSAWIADHREWTIVDTEGFSYPACSLCDALLPNKLIEFPEHYDLFPNTQVNCVFIFSEMDNSRDIAQIVFYEKNSKPVIFELCKINNIELPIPKEEENIPANDGNENSLEDGGDNRDGFIDNDQGYPMYYDIHNIFDTLDNNVYSRLNNLLTPKEATKYDNYIKNDIYRFKKIVDSLNDDEKNAWNPKFLKLISDYENGIIEIVSKDTEKKKLDQKLSQLIELSPREFEEYVADLFVALGYDKVTLTQYSNDDGVDVLCEMKGITVAVQCKKYKGVIGSPTVQSFLGAMEHANARKGFLITTGMFSVQAEKLALHHPIELIDNTELTNLIKEAMKK